MAAVLESADLSVLASYVQGFHSPAYTYVFKLPFLGSVQSWERDLQWGLCSHNREGLDDVSGWLLAPEQDSPSAQRLYLQAHGEDRYYGRSLAMFVYNAAIRYFRSRQAVSEPSCSIYVQSEIGEAQFNIHLVMGGPGLNKYNAKAAVRPLQLHFLTELGDQLQCNTRDWVPPDRIDVHLLVSRVQAALTRTITEEDYRVVDILTYRTRAGQSHAARVNGWEYIVNYLLCKNAQFFAEASPRRNTLACDWFEGIYKTYQSTLINGESVPLGSRKRLWNQLQAGLGVLKAEPVFSGEMFGALPEVRPAGWKEPEKAGGRQRLNRREALMLDCLARCRQDNLLTYEQLVGGHPDLVVMLEAIGGGGKLIDQIFTMFHIELVKKHTPLSYLQTLNHQSRVQPGNKVFILLGLQGYNPWMVGHWVLALFNRRAGKQNTLLLYGPASTGKTNLAKALVSAVRLYGCVNHQNKSFIFNDCAHKLVVWWEECLMHTDWVEQAKCILGGTEFRIDRKHKESQLLPQTPVIISSNNDIYRVVGGNTVSEVHSKPLRERVVQLNFMKRLHSTFGEITLTEIYAWINSCADRFDPSLEGFLRQWKLDRVKNTFPLNTPCSGCSQNFEVHQNTGFCLVCGGVPELETRDRGQPESVGESGVPGAALMLCLRVSNVVSLQLRSATSTRSPRSRRPSGCAWTRTWRRILCQVCKTMSSWGSRKRSRIPNRHDGRSTRQSGASSWASIKGTRWARNRSSCTASSRSRTLTQKETPLDVFMRYRSEHPDAPALCGFYWHSTRLTRAGTDMIFNKLQGDFQAQATGGMINWDQCKELLFSIKKDLDQRYRNMLWHFSQGGACERCQYWDNVYQAHQAKVQLERELNVVSELTDQEMLEAVEDMEVDGAN
nr:NS1 [Rhinolophus sinicus bocaparvovirus]